MRTTLTIDPDVAIAMDRIRRRDSLSLKAAVNEALRRGLRAMEGEQGIPPGERYHITPWDSGGMRVNIDNVVEALDWAEGDARK
jgi:hypothetical protein